MHPRRAVKHARAALAGKRGPAAQARVAAVLANHPEWRGRFFRHSGLNPVRGGVATQAFGRLPPQYRRLAARS